MSILGFFDKKKSLSESGLLAGSIDCHSHILFGVDDGIRTLEDSLAALSEEEQAGVAEVWCTPHVMEDVPNTTSSLMQCFDELTHAYKGQIKLHLAAEYMLDNLFEKRLQDKDLLVMEDNKVLVETSTLTPPVNFFEILENAQKAGYRPILAHPERYRYLRQGDVARLERMGVTFQLNLASVIGFYGEAVQSRALEFLRRDSYAVTGTDCHRVNALKELYSRRELSKDTLNRLQKIINIDRYVNI